MHTTPQLTLLAQQLAVDVLLLRSGSWFSAYSFVSVLLAPIQPPTLALTQDSLQLISVEHLASQFSRNAWYLLRVIKS